MTLYELYTEYVAELDPILWEAGRVSGIHVDDTKRLELLGVMNARIKGYQDDAQQYIPDDLFPTKRFKTLPNPAKYPHVRTIPQTSDSVKTCSVCGVQGVTKTEHTGRKGGKKGVPLNPCYKAPITLSAGVVNEYDVVLPFNPGSDDQMKQYSNKFHHKLGRNWKTHNETLDARQVQKFIDKYGDKHPIYQITYDVRQIRKARGYAKGWVPDAQGKAYGHYKHVPETFRLSQAEHNFMNVSHRDGVPHADELRSCLIAPDGYVLIEADSSSVEAVFTGLFMGSTEYTNIAKRGIHALWACQTLGLEPTAENIKLVKNSSLHAMLYETKKRTVHGTSYGMGAKLLHESYPKAFPSVSKAQAEIDDFYKFVPDLKEWHFETQKLAHKQGFLMNPWGLKNYYYRVFEYDWDAKAYKLNPSGLATGPDAKAAIAFKPQSANGMFQRKNMVLVDRAIRKHGKHGRWVFTALANIHDSLGLRVPEDDALECATLVAEVMNRPIPEMWGVRVGVAVKAGKSWGPGMKGILTV